MTHPLQYRLDLDLCPEDGVFTGEVEIALSADTPQIALDCEGLEIEAASLNGEPVAWRLEDGRLVLGPAPVGAVEAVVRFQGRFDETPRGLYRGPGYLAAQLQPGHTRRLFPCFDDPKFRTPFALAVGIPEKYHAVSNGAVVADLVENGRRRVAFSPSPHLPTYLLALMAGPFETTGSGRVRLHALNAPPVPDLAELAESLLAACGDWLGRPYPFEKLDLVALPEAAVAGMEGTAAVTLRTDGLTDRKAAAGLLAHELAHQWFGGLVTPANWRELWLNEGFATWLAPKALAAVDPSLVEDADEVRAIRLAINADGGLGRPLVADGPVEAMFDTVTYRKGAALLRMLEGWLGEAVLREGLALYLDRHADGTATSADLWAALEAVSGRPVAAVTGPLLTRPGAPMITVSCSGETVTVEQPGHDPAALPLRLKIGLRSGEVVERDLLLQDALGRVVMDQPVDWVFADAGAVGYHIAHYPEGGAPVAALTPSEAVVRLEDAWLGLWAGQVALDAYLSLAGEALAAGMAGGSLEAHLTDLADLLAGGPRRPLFEGWLLAAGGALPRPRPAEPLDETLSDAALQMRVEALLADPDSRLETWRLIQQRWDVLGPRLIGLGGRGVLTGLAAFADLIAADEIERFLAGRTPPEGQPALAASLQRIRGRAAFRELQQVAMDAFLMRRASTADAASDRQAAEHRLFAALAGGFRGALAQRMTLDRLGLAPPPWMHTAENLRGAGAAAERRMLQAVRSESPVAAGDVELARRLIEDLEACAEQLGKQVGRLATAGDRQDLQVIAAALVRLAVGEPWRLEAERAFARLWNWSLPPAAAPEAYPEARAWTDGGRAPPTRFQRLDVQNEAALAAGRLRTWALDIARALAELGAGQSHASDADWKAFGFRPDEIEAWRRTFSTAEAAAAWKSRGFDLKTAARRAAEGADPADLRRRPVPPAVVRKPVRIGLPGGGALAAELAVEPAVRVQGLRHRDSLPANGAMLFVHSADAARPITMQGVRLALDALWLDADGRILHLEADCAPWSGAPFPSDPDRALCRYILEAPAGTILRHGLAVDQRLLFDLPEA